MKLPSWSPANVVFVEVSNGSFGPGAAVGKSVEVKLEDHKVKSPFRCKLVGYIEDLDRMKKGWYLAPLNPPVRVFSEPVGEILLFGGGAVERQQLVKRPTHDKEGRQISYYYAHPLEEMLLSPNSMIEYVLGEVGTIQDPTILTEKRLSHDQIKIDRYVTIRRASG